MLSCPLSWIFVDMHCTPSQLGSRNFIFLRNNDCYAPIIADTVKAVLHFNRIVAKRSVF